MADGTLGKEYLRKAKKCHIGKRKGEKRVRNARGKYISGVKLFRRQRRERKNVRNCPVVTKVSEEGDGEGTPGT